MKYGKVTFGKAEAIINVLGGYEGVANLLSGKTMVVEKTKMFKKLPLTIDVSDGSELQIIKTGIATIASDGKKIFSDINDCIKKTDYDGKGGNSNIEYFDDINNVSCAKPEMKIAVYELVRKTHLHEPLTKILSHIISAAGGDLEKISLNIDQVEHIILHNKEFITEVQEGKNIFLIESDYKIFPVSFGPQPGGYGKIFDTHVENFGDLSCYSCAVRIFVPQIT